MLQDLTIHREQEIALPHKDRTLVDNAPTVPLEGSKAIHLSYSAGYVYGRCRDENDLYSMFIQADNVLYHSKKNGKGRVTGTAFRPAAE